MTLPAGLVVMNIVSIVHMYYMYVGTHVHIPTHYTTAVAVGGTS